MGDYFAKVPEEVQNHLKQLSGSINLPEGEDALEVLARGWLEKEEHFNKQVSERNLEESDVYAVDEPRGGLIMTQSGSLLTIGPLEDNGRRVEYASIGLRTDVPERAEKSGSTLKGDVVPGESAEFLIGPILKSSPVYKIVVIQDEDLLMDVTQVLADDFIKVNKTLIFE